MEKSEAKSFRDSGGGVRRGIVCNGTVTVNAASVGNNQEFVYAEAIGVAALGVSDQQISKSFTFGALSGASPFGTPSFNAANIPIIALKH
jgi:hypothetical protein